MSRSKDIGTAAETAVVRYLRTHGWPSAERRALTGVDDCGDITGTPGICWEVKAGKAAIAAARSASDAQIRAWLIETEVERDHARAGVGILVTKRGGVGASHVGAWWAYLDLSTWDALRGLPSTPWDPAHHLRMRLDSLVPALHAAGYGTAPEAVAS